jgi:hypothetical protein
LSNPEHAFDPLFETPSGESAPESDAGLQYLSRESYTPLMEVWKARTQDGRLRQVKILKGLSKKRTLTDEELEKIAYLKYLKHPRLSSIEDIHFDAGRVLIVGAVPESTLFDRWRQLLTQGKPGIDRKELLQYLAIIAEALEHLVRHANLHHLYLNPASLYYFGGRMRVADFCFAQLAWLPAGQQLDQQGLKYAAPELYDGTYHPNSDQYSLALIYAEMLTGQLPFHGNSLKQWREQRRAMELDLRLLPAHEHEILYRALEFEPSRRFASCTSFLENLIQSIANSSGFRLKAMTDPHVTEASLLLTGETLPVIPEEEVEVILRRLIQVIAMKTIYNKDQGIRFMVDDQGVVIHRCAAWLPGGLAIHKLEGFAHEWDAKLVNVDEEAHEYTYQIKMEQSLWQKLIRRKNEFIEIRIRMYPPKEVNVKQTEVEIRLCYTDAKPENERDRLEIVVPALLCSLRTYLLAKTETRLNERYRYESKVYLYPIYVNDIGDPVAGSSRDISMTGIRIIAAQEFTCTDCIVQLHTQEFGSVILPAKLQRCEPLSTGMYDVGLRF